MEKPEYYPTILQSILVLVLYIFVFTLVPLLFLYSLAPIFGFDPNDILVAAAAELSGVTLLIFWINRRYRIDYSELLSVKRLSLIYIFPLIMIVFGASILFSELDNLLKAGLAGLAGSDALSGVTATFAGAGKIGFWKLFLVLVVLTPIIEETIFRGIILKGLLKHHPPYRALAVSSLLFGLIYLQTWQFWAIIGWGVIAGWWYYRTRSLILCILGRALMNSISLIVAGLFLLKIPGFTTGYDQIVFQPWWFDCAGFILFILGIIVMVKLFKEKAKVNS